MLLIILAGFSAVWGVVLHSELYILLGAFISQGSQILDYYFGAGRSRKETDDTTK